MKKPLKLIQKNPLLHDLQISFYNLLNTHQKGNNDDIFIFTSGRSGSTWLAEVISMQPDIVYVDEPLNWKRFISDRIDIPANYKFICSSPDRKEAFKRYFEDIFNNRITIDFPLAFWKDTFSLYPRRYAFKLINGKELINWFEDNFDIRVLYLVRHPIATALSRINWGWLDMNKRFEYMLESEEFKNCADDKLIEYAVHKLHNGSVLEQFVTGWCIENYIPLVHLKKDSWTFVSYEELVLHPEKTCIKLKKNLDLKDTDIMLKHIPTPSKSTSAYNETEKRIKEDSQKTKEYLINKWKKHVSRDDIDHAFSVLEKFGINIYKKDTSIPKFE